MSTVRTGVTLAIGLARFTVNLETVVASSSGTRLRTLCNEGHSPSGLNQAYECPACQKRGPLSDFPLRGKEVSKGQFAVVDRDTAAELRKVPPELRETITITPHPAAEVTALTLPAGRSYYLTPDGIGMNQPYSLVAAFVRDHPEVALLAVFAVKGAPATYRLGWYREALVLVELAWPDAVRSAPVVPVQTDAQLTPMLESFVAQATAAFDPSTFVDARAQKLAEFLASQTPTSIAATTTVTTPSNPGGGLMAALTASVEALRPKLDPTPPKGKGKKKSNPGHDVAAKTVRAWAAENNVSVPARGRLPKSVIEQYWAANKEGAA